MLYHLSKFDKVVHKLLFIANIILSRAPVLETGGDSLEEDVDRFVEGVSSLSLPATPRDWVNIEKPKSEIQFVAKYENIVLRDGHRRSLSHLQLHAIISAEAI